MFSWAHATPLRIHRTIPADQPIYFISDLHLGDGTRSDSFLGKDQELIAFLRHVSDKRAHLVIVGDAIDFHQAWSMTRVLKAHARLIGELARMAGDTGLTYLWGNHDHDISLFRDVMRMDVCSSLEVGDKMLVQHGYEYDPYIGPYLEQTHVATRIHHLAERIFGTWMRMPLEHFYTPGNRVAMWLARWFGLSAFAMAKLNRAIGRRERARKMEGYVKYWVQAQMGDPQGIFEGVRHALNHGPHDWIVTGHSHLPGLVELAPGRHYVNTGSWTFNSAQYAHWDGEQMTVRDWITGRTYGDHAYRPLIDGRYRYVSLQEWWRENYLGFFRYRAGVERRLPELDGSTAVDRPAPTSAP